MGEQALRMLVASWAKRIYDRVEGSPYQPGQLVEFIGGNDSTVNEHLEVGARGIVLYLEYSCGSGQHYPDDPMIGIQFTCGLIEECWADELKPAAS